jgi:GNAT superfamily N-acetyltransferase
MIPLSDDQFQIGAQTFTVQPAWPEEADQVLAVLVAAAKWIQSQGRHQWRHYLEETDEERAEIAAQAERGEVYLVRCGDEIAGTLTLHRAPSDWDRTLWGEDGGEALYLHRFAINRTYAGCGLGERMLDWAVAQARREGKRYFRLDCAGWNERLSAYYARRFRFMGAGTNSGLTFHKYEQEL